MHPIRHIQFVLVTLIGLAASSAQAQVWSVVEPSGTEASASVCPLGEEGSEDFVCFRLECSAVEPLHFTLDLAGRGTLSDPVDVGVGVDGGNVGTLTFTPRETGGFTHLTAPFDPNAHEEMVDLLQRGRRANLVLNLPSGIEDVPVGLTFSADSLITAMRTCPEPAPLADGPEAVALAEPASIVLAEVVNACRDLGGTVAMEDGFERREDLDGDGREDLVIDYAAAACSTSPTLNCGTGGCTVGFFLARDDGYDKVFSEVIRGYEVFPGGFLALDMHGSACGLYGFEACRKIFDIAGDAPVLAEEIAGPAAETVEIAAADPGEGVEDGEEDASAEGGAAEGGADPVVVAETEGVSIEVVGRGDEAGADTPQAETEPEEEIVTVAVAQPAEEPPAVAQAEPEEIAEVTVATAAEEPVETSAVPLEIIRPVSEDGPTSRHMAGPAPALPEGARFRGDGTLIKPEDEDS